MKLLFLTSTDTYWEAIYLGEKLLKQGKNLGLYFGKIMQIRSNDISEVELRDLTTQNEEYLNQYGYYPKYLVELTLDF
jgi:hypothetical protein